MTLVYLNMNTTLLGVYLRDAHGVPSRAMATFEPECGHGGALPVRITRRIEKRPPLLMMALGRAVRHRLRHVRICVCIILFMLAMVIITVGEMVVAPVGRRWSPSSRPKKCAALYGGLRLLVGHLVYDWPYLAGIVLDNFDPRFLWYAAGIHRRASRDGLLGLHRRVEAREDATQPATIQPV